MKSSMVLVMVPTLFLISSTAFVSAQAPPPVSNQSLREAQQDIERERGRNNQHVNNKNNKEKLKKAKHVRGKKFGKTPHRPKHRHK